MVPVSKRMGFLAQKKTVGSSPADQTENVIQKIILGELESEFRGILMATANIVKNLDKSFERRLLFKIFFE